VALQFRRGTSSDRSNVGFIPGLAEPIYETDTNKLYIGDGATTGGNLVGGVTKLEEIGDVTLSSEEVFTPNFYSITSEVVTFLFPTSHTITAGTQITVSSSSVATLDGTYTATYIDSNTITVPKTGASDIGSTALTANISKVVATNSAIRWNNTSSIWEDYLPNLDSLSNVDLTTNAPVAGDVLSFDGTNFVPGLSGNLDLEGNYIVSSSNGDIEFEPNGTGKVKIRGNATGGSGQIVLNCEQNTHGIVLKGPPHSAAANYTLTLPTDTGTSGQVLSTNGSGSLSWATASGSASTTLHTTFEFNYGSTTPTSVISNSNEIGLNFGAWSILNSAGIGGPSSSTYNPTLTGISFNSTTGSFEGFPRGRYEINFSGAVAINNVTGTLTANELYYYAIATNPTTSYFYFGDFVYGILPYTSYGSTSCNFNVHWNMIAVFEETTAANNQLGIYADQDMGPTHYVQNCRLNILKFADI